jgi:hypothetical protein
MRMDSQLMKIPNCQQGRRSPCRATRDRQDTLAGLAPRTVATPGPASTRVRLPVNNKPTPRQDTTARLNALLHRKSIPRHRDGKKSKWRGRFIVSRRPRP